MSDTTKDAVPVAWFYYEDDEFIRMYDSEDKAAAACEKFGGHWQAVYTHPAAPAQSHLTSNTVESNEHQIAAPAQSAEPLRAAVYAMVSMLEAGEWAEHASTFKAPRDALASRLESAITDLHNEIARVTQSLSADHAAAPQLAQTGEKS